MSDRKISFNKDIAKSAAEELGVSEKMVLYHIDFIVHRIRRLAAVPNITNIYLPHIGFFHWKWTEIKRIWDLLGNKGVLENKEERWSGMYTRLKDRMEFLEKEGVFEHKGYMKHKRGIKIYKYFFTKKMNLKELEEWQNKED